MSSPKLAAFLTKLDSELKKSSDDYRRFVANKRTHVFTYRGSKVKQTIRDLLNRSSGGTAEGRQALKDIEPKLAKLITTLTTDVRKTFGKRHNPSKGITIKNIRGGVVAIVEQIEGGSKNNFDRIYQIYKKPLDKFYSDFIEMLGQPLTRPSSSKPGETRDLKNAGQVFNLEHEGGSSNIEEFLNNGVHEALMEAYGDSTITPEIKKELESQGLGMILEIYKSSKDGKIDVVLGSQILNAIQGGGREKALAKKLEEAVQKLNIAEIQGSDSLAEGQRKKALKVLIDPFKDKKTLKVTSESTKIKEGPTGRKKIASKNVMDKSTGSPIKKRRIASRKAPQQNMGSMFAIMAMLNQKLPQTVEKNMRAPGLESRTGRFASSVRIVDVLTTNKGFPSVGYTYDKSPYQVFEMGSGRAPWATPERDPRRVIDASIRELAAQMAIGRFYTRRV
jgi:hypothetical protein